MSFFDVLGHKRFESQTKCHFQGFNQERRSANFAKDPKDSAKNKLESEVCFSHQFL